MNPLHRLSAFVFISALMMCDGGKTSVAKNLAPFAVNLPLKAPAPYLSKKKIFGLSILGSALGISLDALINGRKEREEIFKKNKEIQGQLQEIEKFWQEIIKKTQNPIEANDGPPLTRRALQNAINKLYDEVYNINKNIVSMEKRKKSPPLFALRNVARDFYLKEGGAFYEFFQKIYNAMTSPNPGAIKKIILNATGGILNSNENFKLETENEKKFQKLVEIACSVNKKITKGLTEDDGEKAKGSPIDALSGALSSLRAQYIDVYLRKTLVKNMGFSAQSLPALPMENLVNIPHFSLPTPTESEKAILIAHEEKKYSVDAVLQALKSGKEPTELEKKLYQFIAQLDKALNNFKETLSAPMCVPIKEKMILPWMYKNGDVHRDDLDIVSSPDTCSVLSIKQAKDILKTRSYHFRVKNAANANITILIGDRGASAEVPKEFVKNMFDEAVRGFLCDAISNIQNEAIADKAWLMPVKNNPYDEKGLKQMTEEIKQIAEKPYAPSMKQRLEALEEGEPASDNDEDDEEFLKRVEERKS